MISPNRMRPYQEKDIKAIYGYLLESAQKSYAKGKMAKAIHHLGTAASWAYHFNWMYIDVDAEDLLIKIAKSVIGKWEIIYSNPDNFVFISSWCSDNRVLTQQYMRAIMAMGKRLLFICTTDDIKNGSGLIKELKEYEKSEVLFFKHSVTCNQVNAVKIAKAIVDFSPTKIFMQIEPTDLVALMAVTAVKGATVYNINLTDHAFWMGASIADYNLEFRPYGMTVSLEKRGFKLEQLLTLPYYPIIPTQEVFHGFPDMPSDAVIVFTGGSLYKILGKDDKFFLLMESILDISPTVHILIAGFDNNPIFGKKVSNLRHKDRLYLIGERNDINEVFRHCDIFLNTYPTSGGLMVQYAAINGKPIISYRLPDDMENAAEELLNHNCNHFRSFDKWDELLEYSKKLIVDEEFRRAEGNLLKESVITPDMFCKQFQQTIENNLSIREWKTDIINYHAFFERYMELENSCGFRATRSLVYSEKFHAFHILRKYKIHLLYSFLGIASDIMRKTLR